jgi:hypothetical protein
MVNVARYRQPSYGPGAIQGGVMPPLASSKGNVHFDVLRMGFANNPEAYWLCVEPLGPLLLRKALDVHGGEHPWRRCGSDHHVLIDVVGMHGDCGDAAMSAVDLKPRGCSAAGL